MRYFAPLECLQCKHLNAPKARKEIIEIVRKIRNREPVSRGPASCCKDEMSA
jgi:hypothetical protein